MWLVLVAVLLLVLLLVPLAYGWGRDPSRRGAGGRRPGGADAAATDDRVGIGPLMFLIVGGFLAVVLVVVAIIALG